VIVLADGLTYRASREMPFLNTLRARGADFRCTVGLPSLSAPGRAVLASGAWQGVHGQTTNFGVRPLAVDSLFAAARRSGLLTGLAGGASTRRLLGPAGHAVPLVEAPEDAGMAEFEKALGDATAALSTLLLPPRLGLVYGEFDISDQTGHRFGAASPEYRRAALETDEALRTLASEADLALDTLLVTADHGHVAKGGHGGPEPDVLEVPLVLVGAGVRTGISGAARQIDIAPTVAALLGIGTPASNEGRILLEGLDLPSPRASLAALCTERSRFVALYARTLGEPAPGIAECQGDDDQATLEAKLSSLDVSEREAREARSAAERVGRGRRMALAGAVTLALAGGLFLALDGVEMWGRALLGPAAAFAFVAVRPALGIVASLSAVNKDTNLGPFFAWDMGVAAGLFLLALLAVARPGPLKEQARVAFVVELLFLLPLALRGAWTYVAIGALARWNLPDPARGFGFYLDILALTGVALLTPVLPFISSAAARLRAPRS
jgi:hypothetical protein